MRLSHRIQIHLGLYFLLTLLSSVNAQNQNGGLEIFLMIDCSKSIWDVDDNLLLCKKRIVETIINNLKPTEKTWDRIFISGFADRQIEYTEQMRWMIENNDEFYRAYFDSLLKMLKGMTPQVSRLDRNRTDFVKALEIQCELVTKHFPESRASDRANKAFLIIISDGINDPNNNPEEAKRNLLVETQIRDKIRDIMDLYYLYPTIFLLPVKRTDDRLEYCHIDSWRRALNPRDVIAVDKSIDILDKINDTFVTWREANKREIYVESKVFTISLADKIEGELLFHVPQLSYCPIKVMIEIDKLIFDNGKTISINKPRFNEIVEISSDNTEISKKIFFELPGNLNIPGGISGKIKFNFVQIWDDNKNKKDIIFFTPFYKN